MPKVTSIDKAQKAKSKRTESDRDSERFTPCSPDMTICGDCEDNRARKKCPRLREWFAKRQQ